MRIKLFSEILFLILLVLSPFLLLLMLSYYPHLFPLFSHVLSSFTLIRINNLLINIVEQLKTHSSRTLYLAASVQVAYIAIPH